MLLPSNDDTWLTPETGRRHGSQQPVCAPHKPPRDRVEHLLRSRAVSQRRSVRAPRPHHGGIIVKQTTRPWVRRPLGGPSRRRTSNTPLAPTRAAACAVPHRVSPAFAAEEGEEAGARGNAMTAAATAALVALAIATLPTSARIAAPCRLDVTPGAKRGDVASHRRPTRAPASAVGPTTKYTPAPLHGARRAKRTPPTHDPTSRPVPRQKKQSRTHYASTTPSSTSALSKKSVPDGAS